METFGEGLTMIDTALLIPTCFWACAALFFGFQKFQQHSRRRKENRGRVVRRARARVAAAEEAVNAFLRREDPLLAKELSL